MKKRSREGFTLVELVVVIMILGILATLAVPKLLNTAGRAKDNGLKQTLAVIRNAIELYTAENDGDLPGQSDDLPGDLEPYLRGDFPVSPVEPKNSTVIYTTGSNITADASPTGGWKFSKDSGEFICNSSETTNVDPTITYDSL